MDTQEKPLTISLQESCRISGLSRSYIYLQLKSGVIRSSKVGKRRLLFRDSLVAYLDQLALSTAWNNNTKEGE